MSFCRVSNHSKLANRKTSRKKKSKPEWDDTVNDLNVHKATPEEIAARKASHKSNNLEVVKYEKEKKKIASGIASARKKHRTPNSAADRRKNAILKEVLYDQSQLADVLSRSDRAMAVVKDLFGDMPVRHRGFPSVTGVPINMKDSVEGNSHSLLYEAPEVPSQMEMLSESVMDKSALNEMEGDQSLEESDPEPESIAFQSKLDFGRFQQFLENERKQQQEHAGLGGGGTSNQVKQMGSSAMATQNSAIATENNTMATQNYTMVTPKQRTQGEAIPHSQRQSTLSADQSVSMAINDTGKVKKTKRHSDSGHMNTSALTNANDLKQVLFKLESELADYEQKTGREPVAERLYNDSFQGYTVAIVNTVTKLVQYLKQTEMQLSAEMTVRDQLSQDVAQLRQVIDALTSDIILTQEENARLRVELQKYKQQTDEELSQLKTAIKNINQIVQPRTGFTISGGQQGLFATGNINNSNSSVPPPAQPSQNQHLLNQPQPNQAVPSLPTQVQTVVQTMPAFAGDLRAVQGHVQFMPGTLDQNQTIPATQSYTQPTQGQLQPMPAPQMYSQPMPALHAQTMPSSLTQPMPAPHAQPMPAIPTRVQDVSAAVMLSPPRQRTSVVPQDPPSRTTSHITVPRPTPLVWSHDPEQMTGMMHQGIPQRTQPEGQPQENLGQGQGQMQRQQTYGSVKGVPSVIRNPNSGPRSGVQTNSFAEMLQSAQKSGSGDIKTQVNSFAQQIAALNQQHSLAQGRLQQIQQEELRNLATQGQTVVTSQNAVETRINQSGPVTNRQTVQHAFRENHNHADVEADQDDPANTTVSSFFEKEQLGKQIAELNQQHIEAQNKLQALLMQQQQSALHSPSPPLSPIPHATSDSDDGREGGQQMYQPKTGIKITMPRIEELEISATSTPSPKSTLSARSHTSSQAPIITVFGNNRNLSPP